MAYGTAKKAKSVGMTPAKGTFIEGSAGPGKVALGGRITKGGDLRARSGMNKGKMPKSM